MKNILKLILGKSIIRALLYVRDNINIFFFKRRTLSYYKDLNRTSGDSEKFKVITFLRERGYNLFPYNFIDAYNPNAVNINLDESSGLMYGLFNGKKIFFRQKHSIVECQNTLSMLKLVQDSESPHRYPIEELNLKDTDIVLDIGAAEGDFTLSIIDKVKKVYVFETDESLLEALQKTLEPWKEKVIMVNKYVSRETRDVSISLDDFFANTDADELPTLLKVDIEGAEMDMLLGAKRLLTSTHNMQIIVATYHRHNDEIVIDQKLSDFGFKNRFTNGYMFSLWDGIIKKPFMRKALIIGKK